MAIVVNEEWELVNKRTGEVKELVAFMDSSKKERWEKVYARSLCDMLEITGDEKTKVVSFLIKNKDYKNRVSETVRSIAEATGVSTKTVSRTLTALQKEDFLHKIRNGVYRFSPHIMVNGNAAVGAAVFREWEIEEESINE